jgi:hypothetical protein
MYTGLAFLPFYDFSPIWQACHAEKTLMEHREKGYVQEMVDRMPSKCFVQQCACIG